jgi:hypothetical protein
LNGRNHESHDLVITPHVIPNEITEK